ncbi:type II toxin-antitoxin system CcdA family antitoxin [Paracoccus luteus]|uniref:type II toxin-antitoxin system CcdA family antitoxin n=1 Tax=Paracoccus luteus TaxID=2508543 RepID=UPI0010701A5A|nr:type II toxin-antitoxin system CcdA family antitoxin [Paracoccus luteus]
MRARLNLTVEDSVVLEARDYGLNLSRIAEDALRHAVKLERNRRWVEENREALAAYAREVEEHGCILDDLRMF